MYIDVYSCKRILSSIHMTMFNNFSKTSKVPHGGHTGKSQRETSIQAVEREFRGYSRNFDNDINKLRKISERLEGNNNDKKSIASKNIEERALDKEVNGMTNKQSRDLISDLNHFIRSVG